MDTGKVESILIPSLGLTVFLYLVETLILLIGFGISLDVDAGIGDAHPESMMLFCIQLLVIWYVLNKLDAKLIRKLKL